MLFPLAFACAHRFSLALIASLSFVAACGVPAARYEVPLLPCWLPVQLLLWAGALGVGVRAAAAS